MPVWLSAGLWALLGASSLLLGAATIYVRELPKHVASGIMAFGCGVLISAVAYDLLEDGYLEGGIWPIVVGALLGGAAYTLADWALARGGGDDSGMAVALGALIDGIPESVVLGVGLVAGGGVSVAMLAAIMLSNYPEALSSAAEMRRDGRGPRYVFGLWAGIAVVSGLAAAIGAAALRDAAPQTLAFFNAVAAGGLLTMVVNTMIPEAVAGEHKATGLLTVAGLLVAFALTNMG